MTKNFLPRRGRGRPHRGRRQMRTRRRWTWRSLLHTPFPQLAALAVVLGGLYWLATSPVFAVTKVQAVGGSSVPQALLQDSCQCLGANIFLERPSDIQRRLERIPWITVRGVYGRLPNRIVIDAAYRQPVVLWSTSVATYTVDSGGTVLYDVKTPPNPGVTIPTSATVPMVYSPNDTTFHSGDHVPAVAVQMVQATLADLASVAPDIAPTVDRYRWSAVSSGLIGHSHIGWWFALGINLHDELRRRIVALEALKRGFTNGAHCNYVDLQIMTPNGNEFYGPYCRYEYGWHRPWGPGPNPGSRRAVGGNR